VTCDLFVPTHNLAALNITNDNTQQNLYNTRTSGAVTTTTNMPPQSASSSHLDDLLGLDLTPMSATATTSAAVSDPWQPNRPNYFVSSATTPVPQRKLSVKETVARFNNQPTNPFTQNPTSGSNYYGHSSPTGNASPIRNTSPTSGRGSRINHGITTSLPMRGSHGMTNPTPMPGGHVNNGMTTPTPKSRTQHLPPSKTGQPKDDDAFSDLKW